MPSPTPQPLEPPNSLNADTNADADDLATAFRPLKKRKVFRARATSTERESNAPAAAQSSNDHVVPRRKQADAATSEEADAAHPASALAGVAASDTLSQLRKQRATLTRRQRGIEFGTEASVRRGAGAEVDGNGSTAATDGKSESTALMGASERFAPQRGHAANVDRHMMAYVDAEIARRFPKSSTAASASPHDSGSDHGVGTNHDRSPTGALADSTTAGAAPAEATSQRAPGIAALPAHQPATIGKIHEVALPSVAPAAPKPPRARPRPRPPRLGRDGKPLPPRRRPRRTSEDLARDALVESLLKESRLEGALAASAAGGASGDGATGETDESLAERFRLEYVERERERAARREHVAAGAAGAANDKKGREDERLKGPKLGGSRSQRAIMQREMEQREKEKEKERRRR